MPLCANTKKHDGCDAKAYADPLLPRKALSEYEKRRKRRKQESSSVDDRKKDRTIHHTRKMQIKQIVHRAANAAAQHQ